MRGWYVTDECGPILGDPTQIHQVVMNLCTNAYHAMQHRITSYNVCYTKLLRHRNFLLDHHDPTQRSDRAAGVDHWDRTGLQ